MKIVLKIARTNGSRPPLQTWNSASPPEGYLLVPDTVDETIFQTFRGFVTVDLIDENTVSSFIGNQEALDAYLTEYPDSTASVEIQPTQEERIAQLEAALAALQEETK